MTVEELLNTLKNEVQKIQTVKDSKTKTNIEKIIIDLDNEVKSKMLKMQNQIIELQNKIIEKNDKLVGNIEKIVKNATTPSYAQVLSTTKVIPQEEERFSIIISSTKNNAKAEEIEKIIKKEIKLSQIKIGINGLRKTKEEKIIISCPKKEYANTLTEEIKKLNNELLVNEIQKKRPKIIIKGLKSNLTEEEIVCGIITQNEGIEDVYKENEDNKITLIAELKNTNINEKQRHFTNYIMETSGKMRKNLLALGKLNIQFQRVKIEDCNPLTQCFHCCMFMHTAKRCLHRTSPPICPHCMGDHTLSKCPEREKTIPTCVNCTRQNTKYGEKNTTDHPANSTMCNYRKKMMKIARDRIDYD